MAELKREVAGEIRASLVPPPQEDVWGSALKGVLAADANIQKEKLLNEQDLERNRQMDEGLQAQIETQQATARRMEESPDGKVFGDPNTKGKGITSGGTSEVQLSEQDLKDVEEIRSSLKRNADGMMQGATTHTESLINQELILKRAIQRRPWLRDEFIKASTGFLGVDVYQRGYMALAENEAARLAANDAADKAARQAAEEEGKAIMQDKWIDSLLAANPGDSDLQQRAMAVMYNPAELAAFRRSLLNTPQGKSADLMHTTLRGSARAADYSKNAQTLEEAEQAKRMKGISSDFATKFGTVMGGMMTDDTLWDETGTVRADQTGRLRTTLEAQMLAVSDYERELIQQNVSPETAKKYADVYRSQIDEAMKMLTGETGTRITKAQIESLNTRATLAAQTSPAVAAVTLSVMKMFGIQDPQVAQNYAFYTVGGGAHAQNGSLVVQNLVSANGGRVSTIIQQTAASTQDPTLTDSERNISKDVLRSVGSGTVINLSVVNPKEMAMTFGAVGQARQQLQDFSNAFLASTNVGDAKGKKTFFDELGETEQQNIGGAFAKSVYKLQQSVIEKTAMTTDLAAFRKNNTDGTPILRYGSDGSILVSSESEFRTPAEKAYLAEIQAHNQFILRARAKDIITNALGRPPTNADRENALAIDYGATGLASPNGSAVSASRAASFRELGQGGASKKPQGAQAPTGTRVYKSGDRESLIGYAEGLRGAESSNNFNVQYGGKQVPVTDMTVGQVLSYQDAQRKQGGQTAIGAYQFTQATLKSAMQRAGVQENELFDVRTQNRILKAHTEYLAEQAKGALGRDPTYGEMYLLHFQGEGDGKAMLAAGPDAPVDKWFTQGEKEKNPAYAKARTVGELISILERKFA